METVKHTHDDIEKLSVEKDLILPQELGSSTELFKNFSDLLSRVSEQESIKLRNVIEKVRLETDLDNLFVNNEPQDIDLQHLSEQVKGLRVDERNFDNLLQSFTKDGVVDVESFGHEIFNESSTCYVQNLLPKQISQALLVFKNAGNFDAVVKLYENQQSSEFSKSQFNLEFVAVAYNKLAESAIKSQKKEEAESFLQKSINLTEGLAMNEESSSIKSKAHKLLYRINQNPEELEKSLSSLRAGWEETKHYYPGINIIYTLLEKADHHSSSETLEEAKKMIRLVEVSTRKAGGEFSGDYWLTATLVETQLLSGIFDSKSLKRLKHLSKNDWEISSTLDNLKKAYKVFTDTKFEGVTDISITQSLEEGIKYLESKEKEEVSAETKSSVEMLYGKSFNYGEITSHSVGNIKFGGQLHDQFVNRFDFDAAKEFLRANELLSIDSLDDFNTKIDSLLRERFGTKPLEHLDSSEHEVFDNFTKNLLSVLDVKKDDDSRTNIMVDFLLGSGDCRHHAYVKQLFFDTWKTLRVNTLIGELEGAISKKDTESEAKIDVKINDLLSKHMVVLDTVVSANIKSEGKYKPQKNEDGFIATDNVSEIEDHTLNVYFVSGDDGEVKDFRMCDSFYQDVYNFAFARSPDSFSLSENGYQIDLNESNSNGEYKVSLKPAVYAGERGKRFNQKVLGDLGGPLLRGVSLALNTDSVTHTNKKKEFIDMVARSV